MPRMALRYPRKGCSNMLRACREVGPSPAERGETHRTSAEWLLRLERSARWMAHRLRPGGPDYQPGHAHCDTLSYELVLDGRRIVIDTGVHDYEPGARRYRSRSTASHNTVMVDGAEQSEIWGVFRVARRARAIEASLLQEHGTISFSGAHDGYRRLAGRVVHRRLAEYLPDRSLRVSDRLSGSDRHVMENRIHLARDCTLRARAGRSRSAIRQAGRWWRASTSRGFGHSH